MLIEYITEEFINEGLSGEVRLMDKFDITNEKLELYIYGAREEPTEITFKLNQKNRVRYQDDGSVITITDQYGMEYKIDKNSKNKKYLKDAYSQVRKCALQTYGVKKLTPIFQQNNGIGPMYSGGYLKSMNWSDTAEFSGILTRALKRLENNSTVRVIFALYDEIYELLFQGHITNNCTIYPIKGKTTKISLTGDFEDVDTIINKIKELYS